MKKKMLKLKIESKIPVRHARQLRKPQRRLNEDEKPRVMCSFVKCSVTPKCAGGTYMVLTFAPRLSSCISKSNLGILSRSSRQGERKDARFDTRSISVRLHPSLLTV
jgi:hypothetical protein